MGGICTVTIIGRLGKDPERVETKAGTPMARFSVATDGWDPVEKKKTPSWHRIVAFKDTATLVLQWLKKGQETCVIGTISYGSYTDKDGIKKQTTDIIANKIVFIGSGQGSKPESEIDKYKRESEIEAGKQNGFLPESNLPTSDEDIPF